MYAYVYIYNPLGFFVQLQKSSYCLLKFSHHMALTLFQAQMKRLCPRFGAMYVAGQEVVIVIFILCPDILHPARSQRGRSLSYNYSFGQIHVFEHVEFLLTVFIFKYNYNVNLIRCMCLGHFLWQMFPLIICLCMY